MAVTIVLPRNLEHSPRQSPANLNEQAKEILLVAIYREGELTQHEFATAMEVTRHQADGIMKRYEVTEHLMTHEEFEAERAALLDPPNPR